MRDRWRWWLVTQLNRLPGQCWTDLVMWAMGPPRSPGSRRSPWSPASACRRYAESTEGDGACYCNKVRRRG